MHKHDYKPRQPLTKLLLRKLAETGGLAFDVFFPRHYSFARFSREMLGVDAHPKTSRATIASILSRLRREGLVARHGAPRQSLWRVTPKGRALLAEYDQRLAIPREDGIARLVIFDIPEHERGKRAWLRLELIACGFEPLQKSVWIGTRPLPERFIEALDDHALGNRVHIFSVREKGTIAKNI